MFEQYKHAFYSSSFDPENRFNLFCREWQSEADRIKAAADKLGVSADYYLQKYEEIGRRYLNAESNCSSPAVVGPAKFSFAKNEKRMGWAMNWLNKLISYPDYAIRKMEKKATPKSSQSEKASEWSRKADRLEALQAKMKAVNKALRKGDIETVVSFVGEAQAAELQKPDFAGRVGFPDYALRNNLANIKRLRAQAEQVERMQSINAEEMNFDFEGGSVEYDAEEIRWNIFFDAIPDAETRGKLKRNGFKWSPKRGAWTRGAKTLNKKWLMEILK